MGDRTTSSGGGNPTQPGQPMPSSAPKHHVLNSRFLVTSPWPGPLNYGELHVFINEQATDALGLTPPATGGWDSITSFVDITTGPDASQPNTTQVIGNLYRLKYNYSANSNVIKYEAHWRKYLATFASGDTEEFDLLVPGLNNSIFSLYGVSGFSYTYISGGCGTSSGPDFPVSFGDYTWAATTSTYQFIQTNIISNPSGIWSNGASLVGLQPGLVDMRLLLNGGGSDNFYIANANGGGVPACNVPVGTQGKQKISSLVATFDSAINPNHLTWMSATNYVGGNTQNWGDLTSGLTSGTLPTGASSHGFIFEYFVEYTEYLPTCGTTIYTINGCTDPNNMAYWGYPDPVSGLFEDCDDVEIPAAVQLDPSIATWTPGDCCPRCSNPLGDDIIYSTQPLTLHAQATDPTTIGGMDGYIDVTIVDQGFDATGVPLGLPTGNANYTYVLQNQNAADTMLNQAAGKSVSSGAVPKTSFTFGYLVPGSNINGGLLQTGATGTTALALSAAQGYVPGGSDVTATAISSEGLREGCYNVYVFDGGGEGVTCLGQTTVCLTDPAPIIGCTDNDASTNGGIALNYDPLATIANNSTCHYCEATNGKLVKLNGTSVPPGSIIAGGSIAITPTTDSNNTDGEIILTSFSPSTTFQSYINDVVSGSTSTQNADYVIELYRWDNQSPNGDSTWASTNLLTAFNAGTTIVGSAVTPPTTGWNTTLDLQSLTAGLIYGRYSIKIYISDPDATVEIEQCYEILDVIVPVLACEDSGGAFATTSDSVVISDSALWVDDPALCTTITCCDTALLIPNPNNDGCTIEYQGEISCPLATQYNELILQYYNNGAWIDVVTNTYGSLVSTMLMYPNTWNTSFIYNNTTFSINGNGDYRIQWTSLIPGQSLCTIYSTVETITLGIWGCTDSTALNYDPLATCDDGCIYCIYGCTDPLATNYDASATCDDGSCVYCIYGCTDILAANYNSSATCDDGSCLYGTPGCTDPLALNYDPAATIDDGSCLYCVDPPMTYTYTTTTATTAVIASGSGGFYCQSYSDGCIHLTVSSTTCLTGQWELVTCTTFCGLSQSFTNWLTPGNYDFDTQIDFCDMPAACYTFTILDCNGCEMVFDICIPSEGTDCGCTDPAATNYSAAAIYDDGSCEYCGCTDENAINYSPGATTNCVPDTCIYPALTPPCIPTGIDQTLRRLSLCIAENGFDYYNKLVTGQSDDCSTMNVWKLILMDYLLNKRGLDCIYNCADANTPDASDAYVTCWRLWSNGGPSTGLNDPVQTAINLANNTKQGTHSTVAMFTTGSLTPGDVIKHHISKRIWIFYGPGQNGPPTPVSVAGLDPENASGSISGYWGYCNDDMRYISNENNINYIDNFINFANTFCRDCDNDPTGLTGSASNSTISVLRIGEGIDGIDGIDI